MKKLITICALLLACLSFSAVADPASDETYVAVDDQQLTSQHYLTISKRVSGGAITYTNLHALPWRFGSIAFAFPSSFETNAITVDVTRRIKEPQYQGAVVITNVFGQIETQTVATVTNTFFWDSEHALVSQVVTGGTSVIFQESTDFPKDFYILGGDVFEIEWSNTNTVWVIINGMR